MTENELRARVCAQARAWLGRNEADGSHREIIDVYNAGRPPGAYKMTYADPWCAAFVSAVGMAAGLGDVILPQVNCDGMIAAYKAAGRWVEADDYPAGPGDLVFYDWDDTGAGDCTGTAEHVGIVAGNDGTALTVIEGNSADAVRERRIVRGGRYIRGFAVPDYAGASQSAAPTAPSEREPDGGFSQSAAPAALALPVLRAGSVGESVRAAQLLLYGRGYSCGPDGADGDFGPRTAAAVRAFQRARALGVDGVIGPATWAALLGVAA